LRFGIGNGRCGSRARCHDAHVGSNRRRPLFLRFSQIVVLERQRADALAGGGENRITAQGRARAFLIPLKPPLVTITVSTRGISARLLGCRWFGYSCPRSIMISP
jgi:hypothetical protein